MLSVHTSYNLIELFVDYSILKQEAGFDSSNTAKLLQACDPNKALSVTILPAVEGEEAVTVDIMTGNQTIRNLVQVNYF